MRGIADIQEAIARENLEGWLFFNFQHRDSLSDRFLGIDPQAMNTRPWYYFIPAGGEDKQPLALCHAIEPDVLSHLPGKKQLYSGRKELASLLAPLACRCGTAYSRTISALSFLDHGTACFLEELGFDLRPSEGLIQRVLGLLSPEDMASHEKAAEALYEIIASVWARLRTRFVRQDGAPTEKEVQNWILEDFRQKGLITEHLPVVAAGPNSGNPHYEPGENSRPLKTGELIQFDIWAKYPGPGGIFADISWVGFLGERPGSREAERFALVCQARDKVLEKIRNGLARGEVLRGCDLDAVAGDFLRQSGQEKRILHRTGHAIDRELHGWGVNLDNWEFQDTRPVLEGSCFSIEPGLYDKDFGCRTEIDVYIKNGHAVVSGAGGAAGDGHIQKKLLIF